MTVCVCVPAAGGVSVGLMCGRTLMTGKRSKSVCVCVCLCVLCVFVCVCVCVLWIHESQVSSMCECCRLMFSGGIIIGMECFRLVGYRGFSKKFLPGLVPAACALRCGTCGYGSLCT
jgi:hypothetical protein